MRWEYPASGSPGRQPFLQVEDGTGGLCRSGVVRLSIPADWRAETDSQGHFGYAIEARVERATWSAPPRLAGLTANTVPARHRRRTRRYSLALAALPLPGFAISLADLPPHEAEKDVPPLAETIALTLRERETGEKPWYPTPDLTFAGPADRVFAVDRRLGVLRFGDGLTGRQPVLAADGRPNVTVEYEVGGGPAGNVGARLAWEGPEALAATNVVPGRGGAEEETLAATRDATAAALRRPTRAVLRRDFEELARTTPGVAIARARAAVGLHPAYPCRRVAGAVTVFVVPQVPREVDAADGEHEESAFVAAPQPDPGALAAVRARLAAARLVTTEVFVAAPRYRAVGLRVGVTADPPAPAVLTARLTAHLRGFLDPLTGGGEAVGNAGWPFGEPLRPSALLREAQAALGRDGEVSRVAVGLDGQAPAEDCRDLPIGEHELVFLAGLELELKRAAPGRGGLR